MPDLSAPLCQTLPVPHFLRVEVSGPTSGTDSPNNRLAALTQARDN